MAGSVWPTFYTGSYPQDHGVYHHLQWDQNAMGMRRVSEDWLYCEPFWYELERQGRRVSVFDVPMTFPSRLKSGIELINWGSHDQLGPFTSNNLTLQKEIQTRFGSHPMGAEIPVDKTRAQLEQIRTNLVKGPPIDKLDSPLQSRWEGHRNIKYADTKTLAFQLVPKWLTIQPFFASSSPSRAEYWDLVPAEHDC